MANVLDSNITRKLLRIFLKAFESNRVITKTVNTQLFTGQFTPASGSFVDIKRPHDYTTVRTAGGDLTGVQKDDITSGKATAVVQNYFTSATEWENVEEALRLDQLDQILEPMARRMITDLESDFANFMMLNSGLVQGTVGTGVSAWNEVAEAGALMSSIGVPQDMRWFYIINPFTQVALADLQNALSAGSPRLVDTAWERAQITREFGGMSALTSTQLSSYTTNTTADVAGALSATPEASYRLAQATAGLTASIADSMQQGLAVDTFGTTSPVLVAGTTVSVPTRFLLNQSTRLPALDASGAGIPWRGILNADATLATGAGAFVVSSPATFDSGTENPQYNTVVAPLVDTDVLLIESASASTFQPNLFYHPQAFSMATVKLPKLFSTDTVVTTEDGFSIRVSKYADGDTNTQKIRFDLLPAYAALNPWFAGHGWGNA